MKKEILEPGHGGLITTPYENELIEPLLTEGNYPVYSPLDLARALRIGYELGQAEGYDQATAEYVYEESNE